jgi:HAE1 family hydrophobic/amphiphilic exporter-1
MALETAIALIQREIVEPIRDEQKDSPDFRIDLHGTADKLNQTWNSLKWNLALAVLITYLLMAALYESWLYPFVIIVSLPLGAVGGVAALQLLSLWLMANGQPPQMLDVITMLGFIILVGNVVNNATLLVDQALIHIREDGMSPQSAILASIKNRIRPIFMTTLTTVFGLLPLVVYPGAGSELYRGLGAVLLGGLAVSAFFTLIFIPSLFNLTMRAREIILRRHPDEQLTAAEPEPELAEEVG